MIGNVDDSTTAATIPGAMCRHLQNAIPTPTAAQLVQDQYVQPRYPIPASGREFVDRRVGALSLSDRFQQQRERPAEHRHVHDRRVRGRHLDLDISPAAAKRGQPGRRQGLFSVTNLRLDITNALIQIFNEIAAVNSVFASSSLPVSANAQGTYLNQVFIGMFRPDAGDNPRWLGNLKQYQFGVGGTTAESDAVPRGFHGRIGDLRRPARASSRPTRSASGRARTRPRCPTRSAASGSTTRRASEAATTAPTARSSKKAAWRSGSAWRTCRTTTSATRRRRAISTPALRRCTGGSSLSDTPFATTNANLTAAAFGISNPVYTQASPTSRASARPTS